MTVRGVDYGDLAPRQPLRIVVDSRLQIYPTANMSQRCQVTAARR